MLLGTLLGRNGGDSAGVSIPREDSCFWELTMMRHNAVGAGLFQSPERIHAFGNHPEVIADFAIRSFNPQRGFMLLGTSGTSIVTNDTLAVSIPREDSCFWEPTCTVKRSRRHVSIPREDSCFWEHTSKTQRARWISFNPQRGFMLLGTTDGRLSLRLMLFQSPERIHAFGNASHERSPNIARLVSIPREDSCFWEPFVIPVSSAMESFNPQRGFMLLGTYGWLSYLTVHSCFNPQRGFMLLGTLDAFACELQVNRFNPQRGFMLLGTATNNAIPYPFDRFQSPERIHAFGNTIHAD